MRELERKFSSEPAACTRLAIVGRGRLGRAFAGALPGSRFDVIGPLGRGADGAGADAVLLCVPDAEIARAAALIAPGPLVGHCSGATQHSTCWRRHEAFSLHPLMTVTTDGARVRRRRRSDRGQHSPRARARSTARVRARDASRADLRGRASHVSRGGVDRIELPDHDRGGGRAARRGGRSRPRDARPARARDGRELGSDSAPRAR